MNTIFRRVVVSGLALALLGAASLRAQEGTGVVTGRVVGSGAGGGPLETARVSVVGTNLATATNREGVYTLRGVPAGSHNIRVIRLGYSQRTLPVTVTAGQTVTLDFSMEPAPYTLEEITTTSTGEARKLEVGNTINTIQVATLVETAPIRDFSQVIAARAPGVQVLPSSGTTGAGNRIRIRGNNSVSLNNEPLFVVDGVRINSSNQNMTFGVGGQGSSRLFDINPEDIADIQVLKGPSASAVYGTGGSNGVVLITTKRGTAGRARWNLWVEQGFLDDNNDYPDNYRGLDAADAICRLVDVAAGTCTQSRIATFNPMTNDSTSPLSTGRRQQYGGSVSGGTDVVQYFISGEWEGENGVLEMPGIEESRILTESGRAELRDDEIFPNRLSKWNLRANTNFVISPKVSGAVQIGYVNSNVRLPQNDNNVRGIHSSGLNGSGLGGENPDLTWGFNKPGETFQRITLQRIGRLTTSASANWIPATWLTLRANGGLDRTERVDLVTNRFAEGPFFSTDRDGFAGEGRFNESFYTGDVGGIASFQVTNRITSKTAVGFQYNEGNVHGTNGNGDILPPGSTTVTATSIKRLTEQTVISKSAGVYIEEVVGLDDRLFVTGSVRFDRNSSTGFESKTIVYPKAAASWLLPYFEDGTLSSLRVRASYGEAGQQPVGSVAVENFFATQAHVDGEDVPAAGLNNFGDPTLKAERSQEIEAGFDLGMFDGKMALEFTGFRKTTKDALIFVTTPPSLGTPTGQFRNAGKVRNEGIEMVLNAQVLTGTSVNWDFTLTGSASRNQLREMPDQIPFISAQTNNLQQHRACTAGGDCYPLGGYWARPYTFNDANSDGIIVASEVTAGDSLEYIGPSQPTREMTLNTVLGLMGNRFQISTTLDYHSGHLLYNLQEDFRCRAVQNCEALFVPGSSLEDQARIVALRFLGANSTAHGFIEKGDYLRWRELSLTFNAPNTWAGALRADRLSVTLTGRNIALWTKYSGPNPEVNGQGENAANGFAVRDFLSLPPIRTVALRVNLTF